METRNSDFQISALPTVVFIVGPTASGKSKLGAELAKRLNGEIISADSMQIYRGMDIGTAKPALRERKRVVHHLIDIVEPSRSFSVFEYRRRALRAIRQVMRRGRVPIVVGGSGLYIRSLLEGISKQPGRRVSLRRQYQREIRLYGLLVLYRKLELLDPSTAGKIKPTDERRIVRALEIIDGSGKKPSEWYQQKEPLESFGWRPVVIGLNREREELYNTINTRVDRMFQQGWVREVDRLSRKRISRTASQAVGYKELFHLIRSRKTDSCVFEKHLEAMKSSIKRNTRRYAKRQMTWFRRERGIHWMKWDSRESETLMCEKIFKVIGTPAMKPNRRWEKRR